MVEEAEEKKKEEPKDVKDCCETSSSGHEDCRSDERTAAVIPAQDWNHQESIMEGLIRFHSDKQSTVLEGSHIPQRHSH